MATYNEIAYNILNLMRGGEVSSDEPLQKEQVIFMVDYCRGLLIKRELDKKKGIDKQLVQDLGCVEVSQVDRAECCEVETDCVVYRTAEKLPALTNSDTEMITYVGGINKRTPYNFFSKSYAIRAKWAKYASKSVNVYYTNGYLYIENYPGDLKHINVQGIFENPSDVQAFIDCNKNNDCDLGYDAPYPAPNWMISMITEIIIRRELTFMAGKLVDNTNNFKPIATNSN